MLGTVLQDGPASAAAATQLRSDCELELGAVKQAAQFLQPRGAAANDHEFVQDAVIQDGPALAAAAEQLRSDHELELGAVTQEGPALAAAAEPL